VTDAKSKENLVPPSRRSFVAVAAALITGGIAMLTPLGVGLAAFFSPLKRKAQSSLVRVALLDQVPDDGAPRSFPVLADRVDAWNRYPAQRIGAVYLLRKQGERMPKAFTAKCPHAGCFIGYAPGAEEFRCPCHTSAFNLDGTRVRGDAEVAPRDMDPLKVELRVAGRDAAPDGRGLRFRRRRRGGRDVDVEANAALAPDGDVVEVWVEFVDFQTGHKEQIPTA
jgi:menaquinol-cytochrome c reductase iron-sulfur subunit